MSERRPIPQDGEALRRLLARKYPEHVVTVKPREVDRLDRGGLAAASAGDAEVDAREHDGHAVGDRDAPAAPGGPDDDVPDDLDHGLP